MHARNDFPYILPNYLLKNTFTFFFKREKKYEENFLIKCTHNCLYKSSKVSAKKCMSSLVTFNVSLFMTKKKNKNRKKI